MHESSALHKYSVEFGIYHSRGENVVAQLDVQKQRDTQNNRAALLKILSSLQYLAMQGIAIRGHTDGESNLNRLLLLRAHDAPELKIWLNRTQYKWISHDVVNEMLEIMAHTSKRICD
jgi:hypothetical protein